MKKGLFISYKCHGYFAKHWWRYLQKKTFDHLILDQRQIKTNFLQLKRISKNNAYKYLLITIGSIPFKISDFKQIDIPNRIVFFTDDDWCFYPTNRYFAQYFTWVVTTYRKNMDLYKKHGFTNVILSQWACNAMLFKPMKIEKTIDVSLIGAPHSNRLQLINHLINKGIKVKVFGPGWGRFPELKRFWGGYLSTKDLVKTINQSKINLNPAMGIFINGLQIKGRTFEIAGCGGFQLTEHKPELYEYFEKNKEIVTFNNLDDLVDKIEYYLKQNNERETIARAAYERTIKEHTWEKRLDDIFKKIEVSIPEQIIKPYTSKSKIVLVYDTQNSRKLNDITIKSINSQTVSNIIVNIVGDVPQINAIRYKTKIFDNLNNALVDLDGDYIAFIKDGDYWEPEKLQLQAYSLDYDVKGDVDINISGWGLSIDNLENEDAYYYAQRTDLVSYMLIPSALMVSKKCFMDHQDEFIQFLQTDKVTGMLKDLLVKGNYKYIDVGYSLVRLNEIKFNQILQKIPGDIIEVIFRDGWKASGKNLLNRLLLKGRLVDAFVLLWANKHNKSMVSCLLKGKKFNSINKHL